MDRQTADAIIEWAEKWKEMGHRGWVVVPYYRLRILLNSLVSEGDDYGYQLLIEHHEEHHQKTDNEITKRVVSEYFSRPGNEPCPEETVRLGDLFDWLEEKN